MFQQRVPPKPQKEKAKKCKIIIKKKPDGTEERSMEDCTPQEARALLDMGKVEED